MTEDTGIWGVTSYSSVKKIKLIPSLDIQWKRVVTLSFLKHENPRWWFPNLEKIPIIFFNWVESWNHQLQLHQLEKIQTNQVLVHKVQASEVQPKSGVGQRAKRWGANQKINREFLFWMFSPSRERIHIPPLWKGKSSSKVPFWEDMLVLRRVIVWWSLVGGWGVTFQVDFFGGFRDPVETQPLLPLEVIHGWFIAGEVRDLLVSSCHSFHWSRAREKWHEEKMAQRYYYGGGFTLKHMSCTYCVFRFIHDNNMNIYIYRSIYSFIVIFILMIISAYLDEVSYFYLYVWSICSGGLKLPPRIDIYCIDIYLVNRSHCRALRWHRGLKWSDVCFFWSNAVCLCEWNC